MVHAKSALNPGTAAEPANALSYIAHLAGRLASAPPKQKGLRTRERLKLATAALLEENGYLSLKASDISTRAKLAEGSFYVYFKDKADATRAVLTDFMTGFIYPQPSAPAHTRPVGGIVEANRKWLTIARANAGLFRCVLQFSDDDPDFGRFVQTCNRQWCDRVLTSVARNRHVEDDGELLLAIYLLSGMMDDLLRKQVVYPDHELQALLARLGGSDGTIADAASVLFIRVLYPNLPVPDTIDPRAAALANALTATRITPA